MQRMRGMGLAVALGVAITACDVNDDAVETTPTVDPPAAERDDRDQPVRVQMHDRDGSHVGEATLTQRGGGTEVAIRVHDLEPGIRGFHVHETPRCDPPDFESAGGHFNPHGQEHGFNNPEGPHAGDLPNLRIGEDGAADTTFVSEHLRLHNGEEALLTTGGALVIHAEEDDYETDPTGEAGDRIACGVIEARRN
jgi:superoxide dismutase, Cu-Zn family